MGREILPFATIFDAIGRTGIDRGRAGATCFRDDGSGLAGQPLARAARAQLPSARAAASALPGRRPARCAGHLAVPATAIRRGATCIDAWLPAVWPCWAVRAGHRDGGAHRTRRRLVRQGPTSRAAGPGTLSAGTAGAAGIDRGSRPRCCDLVVQDWGGLLGLTLPLAAPARYRGCWLDADLPGRLRSTADGGFWRWRGDLLYVVQARRSGGLDAAAR